MCLTQEMESEGWNVAGIHPKTAASRRPNGRLYMPSSTLRLKKYAPLLKKRHKNEESFGIISVPLKSGPVKY